MSTQTPSLTIDCITHQTQRTDFWRKSRGGTDFTSGRSQVDDLDFVGVLRSSRVSVYISHITFAILLTILGAMADGRSGGRR